MTLSHLYFFGFVSTNPMGIVIYGVFCKIIFQTRSHNRLYFCNRTFFLLTLFLFSNTYNQNHSQNHSQNHLSSNSAHLNH